MAPDLRRVLALRELAVRGVALQSRGGTMSGLISLATEINRAHKAAYGKAREALEHARRAGELLLEAKAAVEHGERLPWLAANMEFSERTAQGYMRIATRWPELESKSAAVADLPLREALRELAEPSDAQQDVAVNPHEEFRKRDTDPVRRAQAAFLAELWNVAPGFTIRIGPHGGTSLEMAPNTTFEQWQQGLQMLVAQVHE